MDEADIRSYLADNTDFPEPLLTEIAAWVYNYLDYSPLYDQIDRLAQQRKRELS